MPLLPGKKNIGRNIKVEEEHGKPRKQAVAIALSKARGSDGVKCQCESSVCGGHGDGSCANTATRDVPTIYGSYKMCRKCAEALPKEFMKANDELEPVGAEDPERALALKRHEEGVTKSQDRHGAKDVLPVPVKTSSLVPMPSGERNEVRYAEQRVADSEDEIAELEAKKKAGKITNVEWARLQLLKQERKVKGGDIKARDRGRFARAKDDYEASKKSRCGECGKNKRAPGHVNCEACMRKAEAKEKARANDSMGYAEAVEKISKELGCRKVEAHEMLMFAAAKAVNGTRAKAVNETWAKAVESILKARAKGGYDKAKATDSKVALPEQRPGSEPSDHLFRANVYEVQGDRARALDSYRAAASGFRKVGDHTNEQKARDGVDACQAAFASQYDHPGAGRVRVCDSADIALRTAVERTRAGEAVRVEGRTVRPGRSGVGDADGPSYQVAWNASYKAAKASGSSDAQARKQADAAAKRATKDLRPAGDDTGGPPPVDNPATLAMPDPVPTGDEHEGFKKLESKLSREKGVKDPGALAASIGREKYGAKGMAAKSAAGRARDAYKAPRASSPEWTAVVQEMSKVRRALVETPDGSAEEQRLLAKLKELEAKKARTPAKDKELQPV